jgi:hypothetical protein
MFCSNHPLYRRCQAHLLPVVNVMLCLYTVSQFFILHIFPIIILFMIACFLPVPIILCGVKYNVSEARVCFLCMYLLELLFLCVVGVSIYVLLVGNTVPISACC